MSSSKPQPRPLHASAVAQEAPAGLPFRVGHGWDLHRLEPGYPLIIGGIDIPHDRGCVAHSDGRLGVEELDHLWTAVPSPSHLHAGDVLLHTVTDAILGALCLPDIGQLFPDTDPKWKGARSDIFLKESVRLMHERGYALGNIDCTIIAQRPKLSPHKETIRAALCQLLGADPSVVNIKVGIWFLEAFICQMCMLRCYCGASMCCAELNAGIPSRRPKHTRKSTAWARTGALHAMLWLSSIEKRERLRF